MRIIAEQAASHDARDIWNAICLAVVAIVLIITVGVCWSSDRYQQWTSGKSHPTARNVDDDDKPEGSVEIERE